MNNDKKDQKGGGDSSHQLVFVGALLVLAVAGKVWPRVLDFWQIHKWTIVLSVACILVAAIAVLGVKAWNWYADKCQEKGITEQDATSVYLGRDVENNREAHLKQTFRTMHAQVIGTTNAGKTESVILPWAIQDIKNGSGVLIIDGKSDASFVNKLYAYAKKEGRAKDFRLFSLANPGPSSSFNPLKGSSAQEVTERVFSSFTFENEYYKNVQYKIFLSLVRLVYLQKEIPTFSLIQRLLVDMEELANWVEACPEESLKRDMIRFMKLSEREREERTSGLETMLSHFTAGEVAGLFEETEHSIDFEKAMADGQIIYFQLPTMYFPFLASATGKLVLQCFQNAVSKRQIYMGGEDEDSPEVLFMHSR